MQHRVACIIPLTQHAARETKTPLLTLKKMVQTSITRYLELRPDAHGCPARLGNDDALNDTFHIPLFYVYFYSFPHPLVSSRTWKSIAH